MSGNQSRYFRNFKRGLKSERRSRPMPGSKEDSNRWWRCANCGFPIDADRTAYNASPDPLAVSLTFVITDPMTLPSEEAAMRQEMLTLSGKTTLLENNEFAYLPESASGCPFCGESRWK